MKTIKLIFAWIKFQIKRFKVRRESAIDDLLNNDHGFCLQCGDLFFRQRSNKQFCSKECNRKFYYYKTGK